MKSGRVYGLDQNRAIIHEYNYIEFEWCRKYYDPGEFILYCDVSQYNENVKYVIAEGRQEIGIIQKVEYDVKVSGEFITLKGFFSEKLLDYFTTDLGYSFDANSLLSVQLATYFTSLGVSYSIADGGTDLSIETVIDSHKALGEEVRKMLQSEEAAYKFTFPGTITFWKGASVSVIFAKELGNVEEMSYESDISNVRQKCKGYIKVESGAYDVKNAYTGELYVTNTYGTGDTIISAEFQPAESATAYTVAQLRNQIKTAGKLELLNYMEENDVDVKVIQKDGCKYMQDYDLGDIVKVSTTRLGVVHTARITEVTELWKSNHSEVVITIGNKRRIKR